MLRVFIECPSFELQERVREAVLRLGAVPSSGPAPVRISFLPRASGADFVYDASSDAWEQQIATDLGPLIAAATESEPYPIPQPPELYAVPPYALTYQFVGREQELRDLDRWAASGEPALVFEAIGGMGKSALVWEWLQSHAAQQIPGLAGRMWWSFYERGSSLRGFVRHALAYVTGQSEEAYRHSGDWEATHALLSELRRRPFLLVLDGFERILAAYHHLDKAQIRDDRIQEDLRQSTNPMDGDLMRALVDCAPSKILVTSRLMPAALDGVVRHISLGGLKPRDAESLARAAGVKGTAAKIQAFASEFGCHALLMRVVCGMVNRYAAHPGFFDEWLADPAAGGALRLDQVERAARNAHILEFALARLDPPERQLLARIAVLSDTASYETVRVISPYASAAELHRALQTLEESGLLQWDRRANTYDLHPAVRGVAFDQLEHSDRTATFKTLRDHFAALPPEDLKRATELSHLKNSIEVFRLLVGAGMLKEAASHYFGELANSLMYSVGAFGVVVELLSGLLSAAGPEPWKTLGAKAASYVLGGLSIALAQTGEVEAARRMEAQTIALDLAERDWANLSIEIRNVSLGRGLATRQRGIELSLALARRAANPSSAAAANLSLAHVAAARGEYEQARRYLAAFRSYPSPGRSVYQRGDAELLEASIALETGTLTESQLREGENVARAANNLAGQKEFHVLRARWALEREDNAGALEAADAAIAIVRRTGERAVFPFSLRALALARLGRSGEARQALVQSSNNAYSAEACMVLGLNEAAADVLAKAYRAAWDDGPPHCYRWELDRCRALLERLGLPEPQLAPFDAMRLEPLPHENEIRAALAL
jgi:hypothetical protein